MNENNIINELNSENEEEKNVLYRLSEFIVDKRKAFYLIFIVAVLICLACMGMVKINSSLSSYLPESTETKKSLNITDEQFVTYASTNVMVSNITYKKAEEIEQIIEETDGVKSVTFENDEEHYKGSSALFEVTLDETSDLDRELEIVDRIKGRLADYDSYFYSTTIDDSSKQLDNDMVIILALALVVILAVLLFTSQSFMEIPVFLITFGAAAALNMGTNLLLGEISFMSKSVAVVLQLALAIDYSIILSHRFAEEKQHLEARDAIVTALSKAILEISSSSLTTISGLAALMLMELRIGLDLGLVLCKGILFSLVSVFLLMPGLLLLFSKQIDRTTHKSYVPSIGAWCRIVVKLRKILPAVFGVIMLAGIVFSNKASYTFDSTSQDPTRPTENSISKHKIEDTFGEKNQLMLIVPVGNHANEKKIIDRVTENEYISDVLALSSTEIEDGHTLTEEMTAREFADMMDMDYSACKLLFQAYGAKNDEYNAILGDVTEYRVEPIKLLFFLRDYMDKKVITFSESDERDLYDTFDQLDDAVEQLEGDKYARIIFNFTCPVESEEAFTLVDFVRDTALDYYPEAYVAGNTTSAKDLKSSFNGDNRKISIITLVAVLFILMFTFRSAGLPVLLVLGIQGSIWINFSFPYLTNSPMHFLGYLVVSSIQMGATIDYAIVFASRYTELRKTESRTDAAMHSLDQAFPTILTSGSILMIAGFLIGFVSTNPIISSLGIALGRGTAISIIIVMTVLPEIVILFDKFIEKSAFPKKEKEDKLKRERRTGLMYVDGSVRGYVSGYIMGEFHGVIKGDINAKVENVEAEPEEKFEAAGYIETEGSNNE
ncbi:MAG: MMPL family transporter [bacterium]|nr:MMPL family transporter [bacterium]